MDKLSFGFMVPAALVAFMAGLLQLRALGVIKVDARGLGHEHATPRRRRSARVTAAFRTARSFLAGLHARVVQLQRHPLFQPLAVATLLAIAVLLVDARALIAAPIVFGTLTEGQHAGEFLMGEEDGIGAYSRENITVLSGQTLYAGSVVGRVKYGVGRVSIPTVAGGTGTGTVSNVFAGPEVEVGSYVVTCTAAVTNGGVFSVVAPSGKVLPTLTMTPGSTTATLYRSRHINFTITDATDFIVTNSFTFVVGTTAPTIIGGTGTATISALALGPSARPGNYRAICIEAITNGGRWQVYRGGPDGGDAIGEFLMTAGSTTATAFETQHLSFTLTDATDVIVGNYFDVCVFNNLSGGKVVAWDPTTYDGRADAAGILFDNVDAASGDLAGVIVARHAGVLKSALQWGAAITSAQKESAYLDLAKVGIIAR